MRSEKNRGSLNIDVPKSNQVSESPADIVKQPMRLQKKNGHIVLRAGPRFVSVCSQR